MERFPSAKKERPTLEELATSLEGIMVEIADCRRLIAQTEVNITENQKEYEEIVAMYSPDDPEDREELEKLRVQQEGFVSMMRGGITQMEEVIADFERAHGENLRVFEELKAAKREEDFGTSGTAH